MSARIKSITRRATRKPPVRWGKPRDRMSAKDVSMTTDELQLFHREFQPLFQRREQRTWWLLYLCGHLSNVERKAIKPMVLSLLGADLNALRGLQQFIGKGTWDSRPLMLQLQGPVSSWLGEEDGVVIVDGSRFPKQGKHSVGVAHQDCGALGKIANCQEGVLLVYATRRGYAFVDEQLYVPEEWFQDESRKRRKDCRMPEMLTFHIEPESGLETLAPPVRAGVITALAERNVLPFRWVICDENMGKSRHF